ncbi:uncharacterized protein LOC123563773, partial [Mercenaria mercenaria]|uniref:uncharacterized protein LOC123563773 n=1 Tax=Mercenaria mercenaria TaxID=6596 RepID=UPI00234ED382
MLIEKGASVDTIERYTGTHALHYVVKLSLRIGSVILLRSVLVNYKGNLEKINITENGNTALHIVVKSAKANVEICEDIITLLLNFNCDPSIRDDTNKIPIDYVHSGSKLFSLLKGNSTSGTSSQQLGASLEAFKTEGNKAKQANDYTKALQLYDEALGIAQQSPELYKEAAILYSNKSNVLYQMNKFEDALANAIAAINSGPEYSKGYYRTGKAFLRLGFSKDAFHTLIEGCFKSKDDKDKIDLLTEAATIINTLSSDDFKNCYEMLFNVDSSVWPAVLTQLSKKTQWKSIAYLILGSNLDSCTVSGLVTADCIDPFCAGVAGKSSTADLETRTIFKYLEQHDGKVIAHWLDAVMVAVYSHGGEQTLRNLAVGCPLHAVTRFVLQTGRTSLLEVFPRKGPRWSDMNTTGESESVFHLLAKYSPPVPADFLVKVTKSILEKGYRSIMVRDVNNKLPFDLLDITYPMGVFDLFLPDDSREIKMGKLNEKGLSKSQNGNYCEAILLFNKAIDLYRPDAKSDRCLFEVILRNRAKSYIQQKEYQRALKDARESMKFNNNQEAHLIAGRALVGLQKYKQACTELLYAYDYVTTSVQSRAGEILSDLAQLVSQPTIHEYFRYMGNGRHGHVWAQVCHFLVQKGDWKSASEAYYLFEISGKPVIPLKLNLKPFCSIKDIRSNPWVPNMILYLLHCGSDKMTISLEEGDTYLHAAVRIALVSNSPDMLLYLLQRYCQKGDSDQHKLDSRCNTLLHMATKEKKVDKKLRHVVIKNILGCGVDRNVQNNEKKQARWYLSGEQKNKDLIDNMPAKGIQASNYNERRQIGKNSGTNAVGHGRKERTRTCEKCEHLYSNALRKLSADKTGGFKLLIDLLNTDHTNKHHSDIEKKAVDEFVKYMEEISHKDVSICLNSLRKEKYFTIIDRLFSH